MKKTNKVGHVHFRIEDSTADEMEELRQKGFNWSAVLREQIKSIIQANRNKTALEIALGEAAKQ